MASVGGGHVGHAFPRKADIFISYSMADEKLALFLYDHLTREGVEVFIASASLPLGERWPQRSLDALREASWVFFLASRAACESAWVQQELGAALVTQKKIVPVVWDMRPDHLPGWVQHYQALDLARLSMPQAKACMTAIAEKVKADKQVGLLALGLLVAGVWAISS
jgi:hypothetical protein